MKGKVFKRALAFASAMAMCFGMFSYMPDKAFAEDDLSIIGEETDIDVETNYTDNTNQSAEKSDITDPVTETVEEETSQETSEEYAEEPKNITSDNIDEVSDNEIMPIAEGTTSGQCGDNVFWTLSQDGTLTISGSGDMFDYVESTCPLYDYRGKVKKIIINDGITSIGDYIFYHLYECNSISIPSSVTSIGNSSFYQWESLQHIELPESITEIGDHAFCNCFELQEIKIPSKVKIIKKQTFGHCDALRNVTLPAGLEVIDEVAFWNCYYLNNITIPNSVTTIGSGAFWNCCYNLTQITIPDSVTSIGNYVFEGCDSLMNVTLSQNITQTGKEIFKNCDRLSSIIIPDNVSLIGEASFIYCIGLKEVVLPKNLKTIDGWAFDTCQSIEEITIPDGTTTIGKSAFRLCTSLEKIIIPKSVTTIEEYAFIGDDILTIYGYTGSTAETYANENSIPFVALDEQETDTYIVNWFNDDGSLICSEKYNIGEHPKYDKEKWGTPVSSTGGTFGGWSKTMITAGQLGIADFLEEDTGYSGKNGDISYYAVYNVTDYKELLSFEINGAEILKFKYESGQFTPSSKELKYYYGVYLIDTFEDEYGNDVILTNVDITITAPEGFSFDESGNVTTYTANFEQLRMNTEDCTGTITLYPQKYVSSQPEITVIVKADGGFEKNYSKKVFVEYTNENAVDVSEKYDETDTDGDGLPDVWEMYGITYEGEFLDLPAMGADPNRKDIFVEIDYQSNFDLSNMQLFFDMVSAQYDKHEINLHIDAGFSSIDYVTGEIWGNMTGSNPISGTVWINSMESVPIITWKKFINDNFNNIPIRSLVFRHCIFGEDIVWDMTTEGQVTGKACLPGQYMFIAYGSFFNKLSYNNEYQRNYDIALTFMHELGHTLGLHHGGIDETGQGDNTNNKPNYLSIMNYSFNSGGLRLFYENGGGHNFDLDAMNYSEYDLPALNEWKLNENDGIDPNNITSKSIGSSWYINGNKIEGTEPISKAKVDFNGDNRYEDHIVADINNDHLLTTLKATTKDWDHLIIKTNMIGQYGTDLNIVLQQFMSDENEFEVAEEEPVPLEHSHSYLSSWNQDANSHWHECTCGAKIDIATHTLDSGVLINGEKVYSCTICGYVIRKESVTGNTPYTPSAPSTPQNNSTTTDQNTTVSNSSKSKSLSVKVENKITGKTSKVRGTKTGENVSVNVRSENNGYFANILTTDGEFIDSVEIKAGKAKFTLKDDVEFIIVIDSYSYIEDVSSRSYLEEDSSAIDLQNHNFIIIGFAVLSTILIFRRKRQK